MKIITLNRDAVEGGALKGAAPHLLISISGRGDPAKLLEDKNRADTLRLEFDDFDTFNIPSSEIINAENFKLFGIDDAQKILDFYGRYRQSDMILFIHCDAGLSRSPAVAAALTKVEGKPDDIYFRKSIPNRRVYSLILAEWMKREEPFMEWEKEIKTNDGGNQGS